MPGKWSRHLALCGVLGLSALVGCAALQGMAEDVAYQAGGERATGVVRGAGTAMSGLLPISYDEEKVIGEALALQVLARYNGVYDKPQLTSYVNLVGRAVALTSDRPNIAYHCAVLNHDSINAFAAPAG